MPFTAIKYIRFQIVLTTVGEEEPTSTGPMWGSFTRIKHIAIQSLKERLDLHHGRGQHSVQVFGMVEKDVSTDREKEIGFMPRIEWVRDEELFIL